MVRETSYFVQAFNAGKGGNLKADAPIACKSATGALRTAERLAGPVHRCMGYGGRGAWPSV